MPTNLAIDDNLIEEARRIGHHKAKKEVTYDFDPEYAYKADRKGKR